MKNKELAIGEIGIVNGKKVKCIEGKVVCKVDCVFGETMCGMPCYFPPRSDNKNVYYEGVKEEK